MINETGMPGELFYGPCPEDQIDHFLRLKLAEEVAEFLLDGGSKELGDVQSVIWAIEEREGWELEEQELTHPRFGFQDHVMMYGRHKEFDR
jgi:predicted house-cleaning noncanonical NTP pyrophosphatase (MazG superfamily)